MNKEFFEALEALSKEKSIPRETLAEKIEAALISAYKKDSGGLINARVKMDFDKKELKLYRQLTVVDAVEDDKTEISLEQARQKSKKYSVGDLYEIEVKTKEFGRISAQAAKSVIVQAIRTAEREKLEREYEEKKESIVSAVVEVVDPVTGNAVLELGKNRMTIFRNDQIPGESYVPGDRIKVYVTEVRRGMRGPSVSLSRVHPGLVKRLFELEVPEVAQGVVEIKAIAREPGSRTKIAVASNDPNVDPIG
ncbi:MAG: transcription termination/antitermination protein NusA, partial [Clostridia bacterium]|nr:transcription termination/antitermination protein NusA [Clostridia bacterium]